MASPAFVKLFASQDNDEDTSKSHSELSTAPTAGNTLLFVTAIDTNPTVTSAPADSWDLLDSAANAGDVKLVIYEKKSDGTETGGLINYELSSAERAAGVIIEISGAADPEVTPPEVGTAVTGDGVTSIDPPAVTPTGGSKDYFAIVFIAQDTGDESVSAVSTGYGNLASIQTDNNAGGVTLSWYYRQFTGSSEDPDAATITNSDAIAQTVIIHPSEGINAAVIRRRQG